MQPNKVKWNNSVSVCRIIWGKVIKQQHKGQPSLKIQPYDMILYAGADFYNFFFGVYFYTSGFLEASHTFP